MDPCRPHCPPGEPAPADGALPERALAELGRRPFGFYVHVPFCTVRCGYCDFNTYTADDLGRSADVRGASRSTYAEAAIDEVRLARQVLGDVDVPGLDGLLRRRHADPAAARRPRLGPRRDRRGVRAGPRRRGDHRGQPRQRRAVGPGGAAPGRLHPDLVRHAVRRAATCSPPSTAPTTRCGCPAVVEWAREAGFEQVSLDLIYGTPGESLADWEASARRGARVRARPRLGVLADRRGGHRAGPADRAAASCRCPTRTTSPTSTCSPTSGSPRPGFGWYEVSNWARDDRGPVPAQPRLLDRRRLVGRRPGRALPRRRRALVERQAPRGVRRPARRRS